MKVLVIGSNGQLGTDLMNVLSSNPAVDAIGLTHRELDVSDLSARAIVSGQKPDVVINTAAFHRTDACEDDPAKAFQVNAVGSLNIAKACDEGNSTYVYISTDYVFSGDKGLPYAEDDVPNPINVYGVSKLAGEGLAATYAKKHYIIRSSSLFGHAGASGKGGNFVETMIRKAANKERIAVVDDIVMSPTNTSDLADGISKVIDGQLPYGVYHLANTGSCSWWEFAKEIVAMAGFETTVDRTTSTMYPTKARRPQMSALSSTKLVKYHIGLRPWKDALRGYLRTKGISPR